MSYKDHRLGAQLLGVDNCPHCGVANPLLTTVWNSNNPTRRADGQQSSIWASFLCSTCGSVVSARGTVGAGVNNPAVDAIFPDVWEVDGVVPQGVRNYLSQAHRTLVTPDASVVMSASSIDAMLKNHDLREGSLYARIDQAVGAGILTQKMADWAHRVRLDANNPRHADADDPHMSLEEAKRAFDFANALTEYLYILPSRIPPEPENAEEV